MSKDFSVNELCETLNINKSAYSYWYNHGRKTEQKRLEFYQTLISLYYEYNGLYGAPKLTILLNELGIKCSVSKVSRTLELLGIRCIVSAKFPKKKSNISGEEKSLIVNLIKGLEITNLNQVWTTDISYIKTKKEGTFYLITFIDMCSRFVVSWGMFNRQTTDEILTVLESAVKKRNPPPGLIIHSDKGAQMRSRKYRDYLSNHNFVFSYTSLNHSCDENAQHESFHAQLKKECIYLKKPKTFNEAYLMIHNYIENFYNKKRIHSSLNYVSPMEFETKFPLI